MIVRVARAFGQSPFAVAQRPFAETAWTLLHLLDLERIDALRASAQGLQQASQVGLAVNEPKLIARESDRLAQEARALFAGGANDVRSARARGLALVEKLRRGRVLDA